MPMEKKLTWGLAYFGQFICKDQFTCLIVFGLGRCAMFRHNISEIKNLTYLTHQLL